MDETLRLYRGIKASEFKQLTPQIYKSSRLTWKKVLQGRAGGNFKYPKQLDKEILNLSKVARLERQHFTDNKKIAQAYAKTSNGQLVQIEVPIKDVLKFFRIEFQNFGKRKKKFEIVYVVDAQTLLKKQKPWRLTIESMS